jgi:hypothetical protein
VAKRKAVELLGGFQCAAAFIGFDLRACPLAQKFEMIAEMQSDKKCRCTLVNAIDLKRA